MVGLLLAAALGGTASAEDGMIEGTALVLGWDQGIALEIADVSPPGNGAMIMVPGPQVRLARPALVPAGGPGGLVAMAVGADGERLPVAVLPGDTARVIALPQPPDALAPRSDGGFWALYGERLVQHAADGRELAAHSLPGAAGLADAGEGVWVYGDGAARLVRDGAPGPASGWEGGTEVAVDPDGALCTLARGTPRVLRCLSPSGQLSERPLAQAGPFEQLLSVRADGLITRDGTWLKAYRGGRVETLALQNAGLTEAGEPFISTGGQQVTLYTATGSRTVPPAEGDPSALRVISVRGEELLVYGLGLAAEVSGDSRRDWRVDDAGYTETIFPREWILNPLTPAADTPNGLVISTSGPDGMALITLSWPS